MDSVIPYKIFQKEKENERKQENEKDKDKEKNEEKEDKKWKICALQGSSLEPIVTLSR